MNNEKKDRSGGFPAKLLLVSYAMRRVTYLIRGLVGGYVLYLMYQLLGESVKSGEPLSVALTVFGVVLTIAGVYFVVGAVYGLVTGIYEENGPDAGEKTEDNEEKSEE